MSLVFLVQLSERQGRLVYIRRRGEWLNRRWSVLIEGSLIIVLEHDISEAEALKTVWVPSDECTGSDFGNVVFRAGWNDSVDEWFQRSDNTESSY